MNKIFLVIVLIVINLTTVNGQNKNYIDQPYIEVIGVADTSITPNQIFIKIIITEKDSRDKISVEEQENKMVEVLKTLNINTDTDLTTSDMLSNFKFYFLKKKDILKSKEYILKVGDAMTASRVFMLLEDIEISNVSIVRVNHTDINNIKNSCRSKAILNARDKAVSLTKPLGQNIGNAIFISDNETNLETQLFEARVSGIRGNTSYGFTKSDPAKIEFEKIKIGVLINVKFILK